MMIEWLVNVFGHDLPVFAMLFVGFAVEKHYVSRVTVFTNAIALNVHFLTLEQAPQLMIWYADLAIIFGVAGIAMYLYEIKSGLWYNVPAFALFSSLPVAAVVLADPSDFFVVLTVVGTINFVGVWGIADVFNLNPAHWGPRPADVSRFIRTETLEFYNEYGDKFSADLTIGFDP